MTIQVNIGQAKTRLSELVAAAVRGEDVVLSKAGVPQARLVMVDATVDQVERQSAAREKAIGMFRHLVHDADVDVAALKADAGRDGRYERKFVDPD